MHSTAKGHVNRPIDRSIPEPASRRRCPPTWDGWQCWPDGGDPGVTEYQTCPSHIFFAAVAEGGGGGADALIQQDTCGRELLYCVCSYVCVCVCA